MPYPHYACMREAERAPFLEPFGMHLVTRHADVAGILRDWELFSSDERKAASPRPRRKTRTGATVRTLPQEGERFDLSSEELHASFVEAIRRARDEADAGRDDPSRR